MRSACTALSNPSCDSHREAAKSDKSSEEIQKAAHNLSIRRKTTQHQLIKIKNN